MGVGYYIRCNIEDALKLLFLPGFSTRYCTDIEEKLRYRYTIVNFNFLSHVDNKADIKLFLRYQLLSSTGNKDIEALKL